MTNKLPAAASYCPYSDLGDQPNIIVDGKAQRSTQLTLSHWPWNSTPPELLRDTPEHHSKIPLVSNSHFDEDGLLSMYALVNPENSMRHRKLMIGASRAGDFAIYTDPKAAKLSFILAAYADPATSPLPAEIFTASDAGQVAGLYRHMLQALPELLESVEENKQYWEAEYDHLLASEAAIADGSVLIDEVPELDLAVVTIPPDMPARAVRRYLTRWQRSVHPFAVHNITQCSRLVWVKGDSLEAQYRYESWVQLASRRTAQRVDLSGLAEQLCDLEAAGGVWQFEGVNEVAPRLRLEGSCRSSIAANEFLRLLGDWLRSQPPAWDPYNRID